MGAVNKPTRYNPVLNYDKSVTRRNHVISQMGKYGYISQADADSLMALPIVFRDMLRKYMSASEPERDDYYFEEDYLADLDLWENDPLYGWINKTLKPDGTPYSLDKDGLTIYTTVGQGRTHHLHHRQLQDAAICRRSGSPASEQGSPAGLLQGSQGQSAQTIRQGSPVQYQENSHGAGKKVERQIP